MTRIYRIILDIFINLMLIKIECLEKRERERERERKRIASPLGAEYISTGFVALQSCEC